MIMADSSPESTQLLVAFAKLEGKVDLTLAEMNALKSTDSDHESRLRHIESKPQPDPDTEQRLKVLEERRTISPAQLWGAVLGIGGLLGSIGTIIALFVR
jgi:hypothetical protein